MSQVLVLRLLATPFSPTVLIQLQLCVCVWVGVQTITCCLCGGRGIFFSLALPLLFCSSFSFGSSFVSSCLLLGTSLCSRLALDLCFSLACSLSFSLGLLGSSFLSVLCKAS
jgi:hypothetical protein